MNRPLLAAVSAVVMLAAPHANAEVPDHDDPLLLNRIQVTATRAEENALEVPMAITIVDREGIMRQVPQTVADLVHGEPGAYVQQTTPGQGNIIIRGLKGSEVLHLVDGFRLNNAFFRNAPNQYLALVDPLNLDAIEIVRGPMSTLYGSDAMGGVVQLLTPEPRFAGDAWQSDALLRTRYSSADESSHSRAAFQSGRDGFGVSAGVSYQDVNDLRVGGGDRLPFTGYTQRSGDFKLIATPAAGHELTFSAQFSDQPRTPRHDALVPGFGQTRPDNVEFLFMPQQRRFSQLRYVMSNPLALADRIDVHLGWQTTVDDRTTREFGTTNREIENNASTLRGVTAVATKSVGDHHVSYGMELYQDRVDSFRKRENSTTGVISARPARYPDGSTMDSLAFFVTDDWRIAPRFELAGGLRYSRFDIDLPPVINGIGVQMEPDDVTAQIGFSWKLGDALRLVGNAGRGFRAPNVFDLGTFGDRPSNRFNIPNPELRPETVNSFDIGLKHASGALEFEVVAYRSNYRDKITSVLTGDRTETGRDIVQSRNATRLILHGLESGVRWQANDANALRASLTWSRGEEVFEGDEYPADRIPPLFGRIGVQTTLASRWELENWVLYATRQDRLSPRDAVDARINPEGTAGWATINTRLGWQAHERLRVQLQLENLADKRYREHGSGLDNPGRNLSLGLDWNF